MASRPPRAEVRTGVSLGAGTSGVGGAYFGVIEAWPSSSFGFGVEGIRGGSTAFQLYGPNDSDVFTAARGRFSWRAAGRKTELAVAVGAGVAAATRYDAVALSCTDPANDPYSCAGEPAFFGTPVDVHQETQVVPSFLLEVAARGRLSIVEFSAVARLDVSGGVVLASIGPTLGVAF